MTKIISKSAVPELAKRLHKGRKRIVFTNGVFDILHAGHVDYLTRARKLGDLLIVGLNTDASVKVNKGDLRPIVPYKYRAKMLAALTVVDYIVPLERKTPDKLIPLINPDILVKGADYKVSEIVGADFVLEHGGKVVRMKLVKGLSTSEIIRRIKQTY
ncbi:MAG: D-glycero-beta-D-manno-heptose 1-phosphate adenylyltransferase [bacterium]|nr:D-glycero-beta-D-manno-heptose 1-phosphate adenylyltransferase [bacterium]